MTKTQHTTNHLIATLQLAMGKLNIRGYFTVEDGVWVLNQGELRYPLAGLRSVTTNEDNQIILDLPDRQITLRGEAIKSPLTVSSSQEAHEIT
ncbi:MAG: hypothetical protein PVH64_02160 [Bacillota bacterium]|jgi:hypothetical protein